MVVVFNHPIRESDEWFDESNDDLDRVERILNRLADVSDPVVAAALCVSRLAQYRAEAFSEGNKRTTLLVGP